MSQMNEHDIMPASTDPSSAAQLIGVKVDETLTLVFASSASLVSLSWIIWAKECRQSFSQTLAASLSGCVSTWRCNHVCESA